MSFCGFKHFLSNLLKLTKEKEKQLIPLKKRVGHKSMRFSSAQLTHGKIHSKFRFNSFYQRRDKIFVKFTIHFFTIQHLIVGGLLMVRDDFTQSEFIHKIRIKGARV